MMLGVAPGRVGRVGAAALLKRAAGGALGNVVNIATRADWPINRLTITSGAPGVATKPRFRNGRKAMKNIRLVYANTYLLSSTGNAGAEQVDLDTLRVAASIQLEGGGIVPVTFGGNAGLVDIPAGAIAVSDVVPGFEIPAYGRYFAHTARWGLAGQNVPNSNYYLNSGRNEGYGASTNEAQLLEYITGARAYTGSTGFNGLGPVGILGQASDGSNTECVVAFHDSILFGVAEAQADGDDDGRRGFAARAFGDAGYYLWKMGRSGATIAGSRKSLAALRFGLLKDFGTSVFYQLGENSLSLGTIQADYNAAIDEIKAEKNIPVIGNTVGPKTTSTDNWMTAANQTAAAADVPGNVRFGFRAHVLSLVGSRLRSVADFHGAVRSPSDAAKWNSPGETALARLASDQIHPTVEGQIAGKAAVAARITAGDFDYA